MRYIIGIDPGVSGALSVLAGLDNPKVQIFDTPTYTKIVKGKKTKSGKKLTKEDYDKPAMANLLRSYEGKSVIVCLEFVHSMPGQGSVSGFGFGRGTGLWEGIIAAFGFESIIVTPTQWKKEWGDQLLVDKKIKPPKVDDETFSGMTLEERAGLAQAEKKAAKQKREAKEATKAAARHLAASLYPEQAEMFKLVKHDGRAESLLMAERIRRMIVRGEI